METRFTLLISVLALGLSLYTAYEMSPDAKATLSSSAQPPKDKSVKSTQKSQLELKRVKQQIRRLNRRIDSLQLQIEDQRQLLAATSKDDKQLSDTQIELTQRLENSVSERIEAKLTKRLDKVATRKRTPQGEWIAPHDELAEELQLEDSQRRRTERIFNDAHDVMFELFRSEQSDGGSLVDDLASDLIAGKPNVEATQRFMKRIFTETIPGTETKYLERLIELRSTVFSELSDELNSLQRARLETLKIDPLRVQTGYDPIKKYVEQAITNADE